MKLPPWSLLLALSSCWSLSSCQDEEMVALNREQQLRIDELRGELKIVKSRLDENWSRNLTSQLEQTQLLVKEAEGVVADLEQEKAQLEEERKAEEERYANYRRDYPVGQ
ncbi:hypothetical protein [Roseibacillus ishigakijimensis]|uniref:Uncharacterized protein n=1 Tax=Roseibacillus ishigakijimensis TaxID=454146 RepID=A0A934RPT9_9BACT|nr:hypothetical protein [Roseibacillus ishigakijimensis]MBK1835274.1 hypothetical protein [Roseibacillus ishigakijimensis]